MVTIYEQIGEQAIHELTRVFYEGVARDPLLRPMYAERDLEGPRRRLALFLIQFFGGPSTYSDERGHPRLRMRHFPFPIDVAARDAWMRHMSAALEVVPMPDEAREEMRAYFESTATFLINRVPGEPERIMLRGITAEESNARGDRGPTATS